MSKSFKWSSCKIELMADTGLGETGKGEARVCQGRSDRYPARGAEGHSLLQGLMKATIHISFVCHRKERSIHTHVSQPSHRTNSSLAQRVNNFHVIFK